MIFIQIHKNFHRLASVYVIAKIGLGARVNLRTKAGLSSKLRKPNSRELKVVEYGALVGLLTYLVISLSYEIILLGIESSFGSLEVAKSRGRSF